MNLRSVRPKAYAILKRAGLSVAVYTRSGQVRGYGTWTSGVLVFADGDRILVTAQGSRSSLVEVIARMRVAAIGHLRDAGWTVEDNGHITAIPGASEVPAEPPTGAPGEPVGPLVEPPADHRPAPEAVPRHLRIALLSATRAFEEDDFAALGTINEDIQGLVDAAMACRNRAITAAKAQGFKLGRDRAAEVCERHEREADETIRKATGGWSDRLHQTVGKSQATNACAKEIRALTPESR